MTNCDRAWFGRAAPVVAPELLNKLLVSTSGGTRVAGRITEVEAYTQDDPASHTFRGPTRRNAVMFGPAGHLYVYLSYGIHHCANVVTGSDGRGEAVLVRAVEIVDGLDVARGRRGGRGDRDVANGPGKLCSALAIELDHDALDLTAASSVVRIIDDGVDPPPHPSVGPRVGITKAVDVAWRFRVPPT